MTQYWMGQNFGAVRGPIGDEDWPQNISSGWRYGDLKGTWIDAGTDVIFEAKTTGSF